MKPTGASSSFLVTVMLATSSLFVNAALAFDGYSVAQEFSEPTTYKGVAMYQPSNTFTVTPGGGACQLGGYFIGPVVYQPLWVIRAGNNWIELGTGHQRPASGYCRYYYWGWSIGNYSGWYFENLPGNGGPTKQIFRTTCGTDYCWEFWIGGSKKLTLLWNYGGEVVHTGLESHDSAAIAPSHTYSNLLYKVGSAYISWSGRDCCSGVAPPMCGRWDSDTQWRAGQNTTC